MKRTKPSGAQQSLWDRSSTADTNPKGGLIDHLFDEEFANKIALLESYNKHLYRPNTYLHKWWARRCGSTFRLILKSLVSNPNQQDYYTAGGLNGTLILDPMMGGGTTLHEAIRLGANVIGCDIDPIPVLQARATLSHVPLAQLKNAFSHLYETLFKALASSYETTCPHCDKIGPWQYILYGVRRSCACQTALIVDSYILRHNSDDSIIRLDPNTYHLYQDDQLLAATDLAPIEPLRERNNGVCEQCQKPFTDMINIPHYQRYEPLVVVGKCTIHHLFFAPIRQLDRDKIAQANLNRQQATFNPADFATEPGPKSKALIDRGIFSYLDLFTSRQLLFLNAIKQEINKYEPLVRLNLALLVSTSLEFNSLLCGYKGVNKNRPGAIKHVFAHHAYSFPYTAAENNPLYPDKTSGSLQSLFQSRLVRGRQWAMQPTEKEVRHGRPYNVTIDGETDMGQEVSHFDELAHDNKQFLLIQGSSTNLNLPDNSVDYVITDPPYFDSVQYSDLALFFRVWLRQFLPTSAHWMYELSGSAVNPHQNGDSQYSTVLGEIYRECHRVLKKQTGRFIFTFHHWNPQGWAELTLSLQNAGFVLINRYVVHAESLTSVHIANQNSLQHDVILVLAPMEAGTTQVWELPTAVNLIDSEAFCRDCGTIMGYLLQERLPVFTEIEAIWQKLLDKTKK